MSLMVSFNGQFKPYRIPTKNKDNVHRIREMAPSFNDLVEHYTDKGAPDRPSLKTNEKKNKISNYVDTQKTTKKKIHAKDIMSTKIQYLSPKDTIADGMDLLSKYKIHHIPILEKNILVGIISDRLLLKMLGASRSTSSTLEEIMVKEVIVGQLHSSISDIARVMLEERIHCIPITTESLELKGLVTSSDILELLVHSFPLEIYA